MGYAIGRIGCQVSGDGDYGKVSNLPWAMGYPHGTVPTPPGVKVQPTPIYETLAMGLVAWWLWRMRDRVPSRGAVRVLSPARRPRAACSIEFVRRNHRVALAGLTTPQLESIALIVVGALWLWFLYAQRRFACEPERSTSALATA